MKRIIHYFRRCLFLDKHVCPWWFGYSFDNPLRRLIHKPEKILSPYISNGMTVLDIGCGMGYFSIGMAELVGENGRVISVDIQRKMLDKLTTRATKRGVLNRISPRLSKPNQLGVPEEVDFVLTFWMVHEVPDFESFCRELLFMIKPGGTWLMTEPKIHTNKHHFEELLKTVKMSGFEVVDYPKTRFSRSVLLKRSDRIIQVC